MNYTEIQAAKNNSAIPFCKNFSLHSKYNPEREAAQFAATILDGRFFVVLGLAGGYHIRAIHERFSCAKIVAIEQTTEDISFLKKIPEVSKLICENWLKIFTIDEIQEELKKSYRPALDGNLTIIPLRAWASAFPDAEKKAKEKIKIALEEISADFSVQSHFGNIWQKNIFLNLKLSEKTTNADERLSKIPFEKTAAIVAAGPSLNETIKKIEENREKYYVVATDTAFRALNARKIFSDAVVSVDGQLVSCAHFLQSLSKKTLFVFDLCANHCAAARAVKVGASVIFAQTGHPLSQYANKQNSFIPLFAGSGTVTIAAAHFAILAGFKKIEFFGADFSYNLAPYTRGTYLDAQFSLNESRFFPRETAFDSLMFRTELQPQKNGTKTTKILLSYEKSLLDFMKNMGFSAEKNEKTKIFSSKTNSPNFPKINQFNFKKFTEYYRRKLQNFNENEESEELMTLLPLTAWVKSHNGNESPLIIAYNKTIGYTNKL